MVYKLGKLKLIVQNKAMGKKSTIKPETYQRFRQFRPVVIVVLMLFLTTCQGFPGTPASNQTPSLEITMGSATSTSFSGTGLRLENYKLDIPKDWYYAMVTDNQMNGWAFTMQNPAETSVNGLSNWAGGLWAVSPIPAEASSENFSTNLNAMVEDYAQSDFEAILLPVQQAGLLDLTEAEIVFNDAEVSTWAGKDCLKMSGVIKFGSDEPELSVDVFLTWVDQKFITYYDLSAVTISETLKPIFLASRESLIIP